MHRHVCVSIAPAVGASRLFDTVLDVRSLRSDHAVLLQPGTGPCALVKGVGVLSAGFQKGDGRQGTIGLQHMHGNVAERIGRRTRQLLHGALGRSWGLSSSYSPTEDRGRNLHLAAFTPESLVRHDAMGTCHTSSERWSIPELFVDDAFKRRVVLQVSEITHETINVPPGAILAGTGRMRGHHDVGHVP